MTVTNFNVQQILRTYHRQLSEKTRLSREKIYRKFPQQDAATLSQESKKKLLTDRITQEIMNQFPNGSEPNGSMKAIINQLSQEYGKPLDVSADDGQNLVFKVLNKENGQSEGSLSPAENEQLKKRFIDIIKSIVYDNLV
jgi:type IV secretory pathway VirB9-like protein